MSYKTPDGITHISTNEVRGGRRVTGMPLVLGLSTAAIIVLVAITFVFFL